MSDNKITYTKPLPNELGLYKTDSKVTVELNNNLIGRLGVGFGVGTTRISFEDIKEVKNLIACLNNALDKIKLDNAESIEEGQTYTADVFTFNGSRGYSIK